jgi:Heavy metal binding domain
MHAAAHKPVIQVPAGTIYTCPMHPEVRQIGPGTCPKCGMALEPEIPAEHEDVGHVAGVLRQLLIAREMRDEHGMVGVYFEVAAAIVALVLLGEWLELRARGRTSAAIRQLLGLAPKGRPVE